MQRIETPQNERSRRTRAALLDAAWALLAERGAEAVTMADVATRAGTSRPALYLHFSSRAELMTALLSHIDDALDLRSSVRPVWQAPDAVAALDEWAAHLAHYHPPILPIIRAVEHAGRTDQDAAALTELAMRGWHSACRRLAEWLEADGRLARPWTVETAADQLWALMSADVLEKLIHDRAWTPDRYQELLTVLLRRTFVD